VSEERDPFLEHLGDELERAVELAIRGGGKPRLWLPRRRVVRLALLGFTAIVALSGSALAAGRMLGVIKLGNGVQAQQVQSEPTWDAITGAFVSKAGGHIYHVIGGGAFALSCGAEDPSPTNNIYIKASRSLSANQLKSLLASELARPSLSARGLTAKLKAKLQSHQRRGPRFKASKALPAGVLSVSNGCDQPILGVP
jgi:hypothetical protein